MKLAAIIAIILSWISLDRCQGYIPPDDYDIGKCDRIVRYSCNKQRKLCYRINVCKFQAEYFFPEFDPCMKVCVYTGKTIPQNKTFSNC